MSKRIKVVAAILDPEDGEAGIIEVFSGKVLARFLSLRTAVAALRRERAKYEALANG